MQGQSLNGVWKYRLAGIARTNPQSELFGSWDNREGHASNETQKTDHATSRCTERTLFVLQMIPPAQPLVTSPFCFRCDSQWQRVQPRKYKEVWRGNSGGTLIGPREGCGRFGRGGAIMRQLCLLVGCGEGQEMYGVEFPSGGSSGGCRQGVEPPRGGPAVRHRPSDGERDAELFGGAGLPADEAGHPSLRPMPRKRMNDDRSLRGTFAPSKNRKFLCGRMQSSSPPPKPTLRRALRLVPAQATTAGRRDPRRAAPGR